MKTFVRFWSLAVLWLVSTILSSAASIVSGSADEFVHDYTHPNGNVYDYVRVSGTTVTVANDATQLTRVFFLDPDGDIAVAELFGAGKMTVSLDPETASPAPVVPAKYSMTQHFAGCTLMQGRATISVADSDATTNLTVFTLGSATIVPTDPGLAAGATFDGVADIARIEVVTIAGADFGGIGASDARFGGADGAVGIVAPRVHFTGPVRLHDIDATDDAAPQIVLGSTDAGVFVDGGDLVQSNLNPVWRAGFAAVTFEAGTTSHGVPLPKQAADPFLLDVPTPDGSVRITQMSPTAGPVGTVVRLTITGYQYGAGWPQDAYVGRAKADGWQLSNGAELIFVVPDNASTGRVVLSASVGSAVSPVPFVVTASGPAPSNDLFAAAQTLSGEQGNVTGVNTFATKQTGEPNHAGTAGGTSVWFRWTAPRSGYFVFDQSRSAFNAFVGVYEGFALGGLNEVGRGDTVQTERRGCVYAPAVVNAIAGTTYSIALDGYAGTVGEYVLSWKPLAPPTLGTPLPTVLYPGQWATLRGTGFVPGTTVTIGGISAGTVRALNEYTLSLESVASGVVTGPIAVTTRAGTATSPGNVTITTRPVARAPRVVAQPPSTVSVPLGGAVVVAFRYDGYPAPEITFTKDGHAPGPLGITTAASSSGSSTEVTGELWFANASEACAGTYVITATNASGSVPFAPFAVTVVSGTPTITGFSPSAIAPGSIVTITGTRLDAVAGVKFGPRDAASYTIESPTRINAVVPAGLTTTSTGILSLVGAFGTVVAETPYRYAGPPIVSGFSPAVIGRNSIMIIEGSEFEQVTGVTLDGVAATFTIESASRLRVEVPGGVQPTQSGVLKLTGGFGSVSTDQRFATTSALGVTGVSETSGPVGAVITLTGFNLDYISPGGAQGACTVGGVPITAWSLNGGELSFPIPAGAQTGKIVLTCPNGSWTSPDNFVVTTTGPAPANDSFAQPRVLPSTSSGSENGSNKYATTESGEAAPTDNRGGHSVWFRWTAPSSGWFVFDQTKSLVSAYLAVYGGSSLSDLTLIAEGNSPSCPFQGSWRPAVVSATAGVTYHIKLDGYQEFVGPYRLEWQPLADPSVTSFTPESLYAGQRFVVYGHGFVPSATVKVNGVLATSVDVMSPEAISVVIGTAATSGPVAVTTPVGTATSTQSLTVVVAPAPTISQASAGPDGRSPYLSISGTALSLGTAPTVRLNGRMLELLSWASDQVTALVPTNAVTGKVTVQTSRGTATSPSDVFIGSAAITGFAPASAPAGATVTINGARLTGASAVTFDGLLAAGCTVLSDTSITAIVPNNARTGKIAVMTPQGNATSDADLTVTSPCIVSHPADATIYAGESATFRVVVTSASAVTYQWTRDGWDIPGATSPTLTLEHVQLNEGGAIRVVVRNAQGSIVSDRATLNVFPVAPVILSPRTATAIVGRSFTYATVTNTFARFLLTGSLPAGLQFDGATGVISGRPTATGTTTVTLTAQNGTAPDDVKTLTITVQPPAPVISSPAAVQAPVDQPFIYTITGTNSPTWVNAVDLPPGLEVSGNTITGRPTRTGTFVTTIRIGNASGTATQTVVFTFAPQPLAPVYAGSLQVSATQNSTLSFTPAFTNDVSLPYSIVNPVNGDPMSLPAGLALNTANGVITGIPTQVGTFPIALRARGTGGSTDVPLTIVVNPSPQAPVITSPSTATGQTGVAFGFDLAAHVAADSFTAVGLPALGLSLDPATGRIRGTPSASGTRSLRVSATNRAGTGPAAALVITINPPADAPVISSAAIVRGRVGQALGTFQLVASNAPVSYQRTSGTLPGGLVLDARTGAIAGTPDECGRFTAAFAAVNGSGNLGPSLEMVFEIAADVGVPVVTSSARATGQVGQPFQYTIEASNDPDSFWAGDLPAWLSLVGRTLTGIPPAPTKMPIEVYVRAERGSEGASLWKQVAITILPAPSTPVITSALEAAGRVGVAFTHQLRASESPTAFSAAPLPAGLTLNVASGQISGTPREAGRFSIDVSAQNAAGTGEGKQLNLVVAPVASAPRIIGGMPAPGRVGVYFAHTLSVSGGGSTCDFTLAGDLPAGLSFNTGTGLISGTPAEPGRALVMVSATSGGLTSMPQDLLLTIQPAEETPVITSSSRATGTVGEEFSYTITATHLPTNVPLPPTCTLEAVGLPAGLSVNPSTGRITGVPAEAGTYEATLVGTNASGSGALRGLVIVIGPPQSAPTITSAAVACAQVGRSFVYQITATNAPVRFGVIDPPAWLTVSPPSGTLGGTPTQPGSYALQLMAANTAGESAPATLTVNVAPAANTPVVTSSRTAGGRLGTAFSHQIKASNSPTSFRALGLPPGLTLSTSSGNITGTPTASGEYRVIVDALNANGVGSPVTLTITIEPSLQLVVP